MFCNKDYDKGENRGDHVKLSNGNKHMIISIIVIIVIIMIMLMIIIIVIHDCCLGIERGLVLVIEVVMTIVEKVTTMTIIMMMIRFVMKTHIT